MERLNDHLYLRDGRKARDQWQPDDAVGLLPCLSMHVTIPLATPPPTVVSVVRRGHRGSEVHLQGAAAVAGMDDKEDKIVGR
jgi:hypothetical protein